jgi:alpha-2-macroglobulin
LHQVKNTVFMGRIFIFLICVLLTNYGISQIPKYQKYSNNQYCFKITSTEALAFAKANAIDIEKLEKREADFVYNHKSNVKDSLPIGFYIVCKLVDLELKANLCIQSNLSPHYYSNLNGFLLQLRDVHGNLCNNPTLQLGPKTITYNNNLKGFVLKQSKLEEKLLLLAAGSDTTIYEIEKKSKKGAFFYEKWRRVKYSKPGRLAMWLPERVMSIWNDKYQNKNRRERSKKPKGYIIFNQPKYKLGDTVRWKTFLVNKNGKPIHKKLDVVLQYNKNNKYYSQTIASSNPNTKGNYYGQFFLADTLPNDKLFELELVDRKDKEQIAGTFRIDDYVLDEVSKHTLRVAKEMNFKNDSIKINLSAKDANDLYILDGKVQLVVLNKSINTICDSIGYVPDTLYSVTKELSTTTDTEITIATNQWPNVNAEIEVKAVFSNSNNEQTIKLEYVQYKTNYAQLKIEQDKDSIVISFMENNVSKKVNAFYKVNDHVASITLPTKLKLNGVMQQYSVYYKDTINNKLYSDSYMPKFETSAIQFERIATNDSAGFVLHNSNKYPIQYTLYKKGRVMQKGFFETATFKWVKAFKENEIYELEYKVATKEGQYYNSSRKQTIALIKHLLQIKIDNKDRVMPGEKDNITITVNNYKDKPVSNVNLTAVSYNKQFSKDVQIPILPNLQVYKTKRPFVYKNYSIDELEINKNYNAGVYANWINKLGEQNNKYYDLLSTPVEQVQRYATADSITQVSFHLLENGMPKPINLIYIDDMLVYYSGTTMHLPMSFAANWGYRNVRIRTYDTEYTFKNLLVIDKMKNEYVFNVNGTNAEKYNAVAQPIFYTPNEILLLNNTLLKVTNEYNNNGNYIFQGDKVYKIGYSYYGFLLGPLKLYNDVHFYKPHSYINSFKFEPGYTYTVDAKKVKMVKENFFNVTGKYATYLNNPTTLNVMDTVMKQPVIDIEPITQIGAPYIDDLNKYISKPTPNDGQLYIELPTDTAIRFMYLKPIDTALRPLVYTNKNKLLTNISAGNYSINIMTTNGNFLLYKKIKIQKDNTAYVDLRKHPFSKENNNFIIISNTNQIIIEDSLRNKISNKIKLLDSVKLLQYSGKQYVGKIIDEKGNPISFASVKVKNTTTGVAADAEGNFSITANENDELLFAAVGYNTSTIKLTENKSLVIALSNISNDLEEVVVVGYAAVKRMKSVTSSVATISGDFLNKMPGVEMDKVLEGKVAGLVGSSDRIMIRGTSSLSSGQPLYIVDGVIVTDVSKMNSNEFSTVEILKDAAATALYGAAGANGVVIITTGNTGTVIRKDFKDYAIWQPNLTTNKKGIASFDITYPDNITGWQMYILAMDGKKRIGQSSKLVTAYKPLAAQLSVPQFLLQGDSAFAVGKVVNYTADTYKVNTLVNEIASKEFDIKPNASFTQPINLVANNTTKLTTKFAMQTTTGFKDAEVRSIPVLPIGTSESNGSFWVLANDTMVQYNSQKLVNTITVTAQNNTIDVLLDEIENIKNYSYYCMEQTASKLIVLQAEKEIRKQLNQSFKDDKLITKFTDKLLKAQLYNGGWNWWGGQYGEANEYITQHVLKALSPQKENTLVQNALYNGKLYLQSKLVQYNPQSQVHNLLLLRQLDNKYVDYKSYLDKIVFDSLQIQQKLQYILIKQQEQLPYNNELQKVMQLKKETILGGMFWSSNNEQWYSDANSVTVLAYQVLKNDNKNHPNLQNIFQYFLEQKRRGYWMNTYTSINILQTILPEVLASTSYNATPTLQVTGDTTFSVNKFPFTTQINNVQQLQFKKQGTGLMYLTAYETFYNAAPTKVEKDFIVTTTLLQKGEAVNKLQANENTQLLLQINCTKEANYVMIELPIPAGCIYNTKNQDYRIVHTEYFKDKVVMFAEKLSIGKHDFKFELQTRYNGTYTLNPAKVSLMYYPIFFGREGLKKIKVEE